MTRFGIEEEFFLVDRESLAPVAGALAAQEAIRAGGVAGTVVTEFLTCQVEHATTPHVDRQAAQSELRVFRDRLTEAASVMGAASAAVGTPFGVATTSVTPGPRYEVIASWLGDIVGSHQVNGMHVHVEFPEVEERVRAMNGLRPWLPALLALSGNSPFWHRRDTGFRSWRSVLMRRFPTMGCPPLFRDASHYAAAVDQLVALRAAPDTASVAWAARLCERYPTVEVRVFDVQLTVEDAVLLATITRAALRALRADDVLADDLPQSTEAVNASLWMAARDGLDARLLHPISGAAMTARAVVADLFNRIAPALQDTGDLRFAQEQLGRILVDGTGADRQRRAYARDGLSGLRALTTGTTGIVTPAPA